MLADDETPVDARLGDAAVRSFLADKRQEIAGRALMGYPRPAPDEAAGVAVWAQLLHVLAAPVVIRHPHLPLTLELSNTIGPRLAYLISIGDYELGDLELIERHVQAGDRVLELGGGAGLTAAMSAVRSGQPVIVAEPDARLFPVIHRQVELNGGVVRFEHGAVLGGAHEASVDFYLDDEIWFSSTTPTLSAFADNPREPIRVPVLELGELLIRHRPSVLMVDIEGSEREVFEAELAHRPTTILIEIHAPIFGETEAAKLVQRIIDHGYRFIDQRAWTYVFRDAR